MWEWERAERAVAAVECGNTTVEAVEQGQRQGKGQAKAVAVAEAEGMKWVL